jgi:hypothetical protein
MTKRAIGASFAHSLLWFVLFTAMTVSGMSVAEPVLFYIMHGKLHRTRAELVSMMMVQTPMIGIIAVIGMMLIFTLPQVFQAALVAGRHQMVGSRARFELFSALPLTAVLTWYCYDYLTPSDFVLGINDRTDWIPTPHGISVARYIGAFAFQFPVTLFSFLYLDAGFRDASRRPLLIASFMTTIAVCRIWGYVTAQQQIALLSRR